MAHNELPDVSPEELAALDELARLLEQYQTYLMAGHGFADSARTQAGNASGTARPVLERLHSAGVAQVDAALRLLRTEEDRKRVLEDLEPALKDLRALLATAKWRKRMPDTTAGPPPAIAGRVQNPVTEHFANPLGSAASASAPTGSRSRAWIWIGGGLLVGLFLGAFGTDLTRSASALSRVWILLGPVIAAGSGGVLGNLLFQSNTRDLKDTVRKHWVALLVCSVLLLSTVPTAVDAAKELLGMGAASHTTAQSPAPANPSSPQSSVPAPASNPSSEQSAAPAPASSPSPEQSAAPAAGSQTSQSPAALPSVPPPTQGKETPRTNRSSPAALSGPCARLLERVTLGEKDTFTASEKALLQQCK